VVPLLVIILLGVGALTTFWLGWIQVRRFIHAWGVISGKYDNPRDKGDITHFQALTTALSATVGIGNIAGVATAIHYGGPGVLFWMWLSAIFGMALKYAECTLSMRYRVIHADGSASGGPMYYIEKGLGSKWKPLAIFFAICTVISSYGSGNSVQAFTVADQIRADLFVPTWITGFVMAFIIGLVILGGIKRIGRVTSMLSPAMMTIYLLGGLFILGVNYKEIPGIFMMVIKSAFEPAAKVGGFAGAGFIFVLTWGVKRALFSNEAGQGSAPIAHAAAKTKEPAREGIVAMVGPFIDTLMICSITGLVILTTGVWKDRRLETIRLTPQADIKVIKAKAQVQTNGVISKEDLFDGILYSVKGKVSEARFVRNHSLVEGAKLLTKDGVYTGELKVKKGIIVFKRQISLFLRGKMAQNGSPLTSWAFKRGLSKLGDWGHLIVTLAVFLFAISTAISWSYYGDRSIMYLFGPKAVLPYRIVFVCVHFLGAIVSLEIVWGFGDIALGMMALPNLIAILILLPKTKEITQRYISQKQVPYKNQIPRQG
jgi:AGCS family alanine or glycine:cation symporter